MKSYADVTSKDAIEAVATGIVAGATKAMTTHGDDPEAIALVALGFAAAIFEIEKQISPDFRLVLIRILMQQVKVCR